MRRTNVQRKMYKDTVMRISKEEEEEVEKIFDVAKCNECNEILILGKCENNACKSGKWNNFGYKDNIIKIPNREINTTKYIKIYKIKNTNFVIWNSTEKSYKQLFKEFHSFNEPFCYVVV